VAVVAVLMVNTEHQVVLVVVVLALLVTLDSTQTLLVLME
jgi:hypothetical protein